MTKGAKYAFVLIIETSTLKQVTVTQCLLDCTKVAY